MQVTGGGLEEVAPHTQLVVLVVDILTANGSMPFLNVMDLGVATRLYHIIYGYSIKSACMFVF